LPLQPGTADMVFRYAIICSQLLVTMYSICRILFAYYYLLDNDGRLQIALRDIKIDSSDLLHQSILSFCDIILIHFVLVYDFTLIKFLRNSKC
jgi:hypothetical protein